MLSRCRPFLAIMTVGVAACAAPNLPQLSTTGSTGGSTALYATKPDPAVSIDQPRGQRPRQDQGGEKSGPPQLAIGDAMKRLGPARTDVTYSFAKDPATRPTDTIAVAGVLVRDPAAEVYLQGIARRLLAHWHGPAPARVGVFVYTSPQINAFATPHGDVFVSSAVFERFGSEDELAVLMAHELGHVLMNHHESNRQAHAISRVADLGAQVAIAAAFYKNSSRTKIGSTTQITLTDQGAFTRQSGQALAATLLTKTVTTDVALNAFSRHQEYEADHFGVELTIRAGYDPTAMSDVLSAFRAGEAAAAADRQKNPPQPNSIQEAFGMALRDLASPLLQTHPSADDRDAALKRALANAGHAGAIPPKRRTDAFRKLATTGRFARLLALYRLTHGALVAARDGDGAKADRLLREALPKAIDATPDMRLMLYAALRAQPGRADEAYRLLASTPPQAPGSLDFYRVLAMEHIERGAFAEAGRVLDRGDQVLSAPTGLLTARITLARMQNDAARLQSALARCQASGDAALVKLCGAAATGVDPEAEFKAGGGLLAAFGTGGATGTPGGGGGILNSVLSGAGSAAGGVGAVLGSIFKQ